MAKTKEPKIEAANWRDKPTGWLDVPLGRAKHLVEVLGLETLGDVADALEAGNDLGFPAPFPERVREQIERAKLAQPSKAEIDETRQKITGKIGQMPEANGKPAKQKRESVLTLGVAYGNVNIGQDTARVSMTIKLGSIPLADAFSNLCGVRISGRIVACLNGRPDQKSLPGLESDAIIEGVFDTKGMSVTRDHIGFGATFVLSSIDVKELSRFAKKEGRIEIESAEEIETETSEESE